MPNDFGPIIYQQDTHPSTSPLAKRRWLVWFLRALAVVLIVVIGYVVYQFAARYFNLPGANNDTLAVLPVSDGQIILSTTQTAPVVNQPVPITVKAFTGGRTAAGIDLVLTYDPEMVSADQTSVFTPGPLFKEFPIINIDQAKGVIRISGIASLAEIGFNGVGNFGTVNLTPTKSGSTTIKLDYQPQNISESNMIEYGTGQDILGQGAQLVLKVK